MPTRPPVTPELIPSPFGPDLPPLNVDRFSLRPFGDYVRALARQPGAPGLTSDPEPLMFRSGSGDLPAYTASGASPDTLRGVHWALRHTAAMITDGALLYAILEASAVGPGVDLSLRTREGAEALDDYRHRVHRWAMTGVGRGARKPGPAEAGPEQMTADSQEYADLWETTAEKVEAANERAADARWAARNGAR